MKTIQITGSYEFITTFLKQNSTRFLKNKVEVKEIVETEESKEIVETEESKEPKQIKRGRKSTKS